MNTLVGAGAVRLATARSCVARGKVAGNDRVADGPPHEVLAEHRPNEDRTSCTACGFALTQKNPLCPPAVDALRELATGGARTRKLSPLGRYSTGRLREMAREHTGEGRCQRCGFVYSGKMRLCPTARRIAAEFEARGKAPVTLAPAGQGLCAGKGSGWTVQGKAPGPWKRAMAACSMCPLLEQCDALLEARIAAKEVLSEQIQAGRLFGADGREITPREIEQYAVNRGWTKPKPRKAPAPITAPALAPLFLTRGQQLALFEAA